MDMMNARLLSIEQATDIYLRKEEKNTDKKANETATFDDIFKSKIHNSKEVVFSKHANNRLESRNISLSSEQLGRLSEGVEKARVKNINESLVMMDNIAFIVNVKNNTVVTALGQDEGNSVFTNIDGAVIV